MADPIIVQFQRDGISGLVQSSISLFGMDINSFVIGNAVAFTPTPDEEGVHGVVTYMGARNGIKIKTLDDGATVRVTCVIPEDEDNISIGNVMLYGRTPAGIFPIVLLVLPELVIKQNISPTITDGGFPYPPTRAEISLTIKYVDAVEFGVEPTVQIIAPNYSNLPFFPDDASVPAAGSNPWSQFMVNRANIWAAGPGLVVKDGSDHYFGSPMWQNMGHPKFGIFGGNTDTGLRVEWIWGGTYDVSDQFYEGDYGGGATYSDEFQPDDVFGGEPY